MQVYEKERDLRREIARKWTWMDAKTWKLGRGYTLRREEKGTEVIDWQRVAGVPLCRYGCKLLKRKGLQVAIETKELTTGEKIGIGERETRGTIAWNYSACQVIVSTSFERIRNMLES